MVASAFPAVKEPVGCWYKLPNASVSAEAAVILAGCLYQANTETNITFEEQVVNFAQAYDGRITLLFEKGFTHDSNTCRCRCSRLKVSPLHLQQTAHTWRPVPFLVEETDKTMPWPQISVCAARINTIVHHFNSVKNRIRCTDKKKKQIVVSPLHFFSYENIKSWSDPSNDQMDKAR